MDTAVFLQLKKVAVYLCFSMYSKFYGTLDLATGTQVEQAPPEKCSEKHLKTA